MANMILIPALNEFRALYPNIQIALGITDKPVSLIEEAVDVVVRLGRLADTSLKARTIYVDSLATCASPAYLRCKPAITDPAQLEAEHCTVGCFSKATGETRPLMFHKDEQSFAIKALTMSSNDSTGYVNMLLAGLRVGQTYRSSVSSYLASGQLVTVLDDWTTGTEPISVLFPPSKTQNARVRAFIDWLTAYLSRNVDGATASTRG